MRQSEISNEDKMRTLVDHIAQQLGNSIEDLCEGNTSGKRVLVTGGGALNKSLISHLISHTKAEIILPNETEINYKEALAFGLLGLLRVKTKSTYSRRQLEQAETLLAAAYMVIFLN